MVKFTPILFKFPTLNKKAQENFSLLPLGDLSYPLMLLENPVCCIKSECYEKNGKGLGKNKCYVIKIGKYDNDWIIQRHVQTCKQVAKIKRKNGGRKLQEVGMGVAIKNVILT